MFKLNLFFSNNFHTHIVARLPQYSANLSTSYLRLLSVGSKLEILLSHLESQAIKFVATREKEPGKNLKECVQRGYEKTSHHYKKFGLNFFKIHKQSQCLGRLLQRTSQSLTSISSQTHAQVLITSSASNLLSWDSSPKPQGGATVRNMHMELFTKVSSAKSMTRQSQNQISWVGAVAA